MRAPEELRTCKDCDGRGEFIVNEPFVSRWAIDPPGTYEITCETCGGSGFFICEVMGD